MKRRNQIALAVAALALAALVVWARIELKEGDRVKEGQSVALLTPTAPALLDARAARELEARVGATEARLAAARAEALRAAAFRDQARADFERQAKLARDKFVAESAREQAFLALRTAERNVEAARFSQHAAEHDLEQARAALHRYKSGEPGARWEVTAPVGGAVLKVIQKSEGPVALGAPLLELADARALEAVVDVLSQEAVAIRPGMPARVELGQGVPPLAARVRLIEPGAFTKVSALGIEEQRVNVVLDFSDPLDNVQTLGDGFRVEAHIVTQRLDDAIKVPVGALWRDSGRAGEQWAVFVVEGGRARKRNVEVRLRNTVEAVVEKGLAAGERVVVYPSDALSDGARLDLRDVKAR
jgi:HlyD family secretion protein